MVDGKLRSDLERPKFPEHSCTASPTCVMVVMSPAPRCKGTELTNSTSSRTRGASASLACVVGSVLTLWKEERAGREGGGR